MSLPIVDEGIFVSADRWRELRGDPAFVELMRLARVANALSLFYPPILASLEDQSPRARRERFAAMFYAAALLHEGLHTAQGLGRYFRDLPQYKDEFAAIFDDPVVRSYRSEVLDRIRDELVFHVDRDALAAGIQQFPEGETLIATFPEGDWSQGQVYFDLADDAVLGYLFGHSATEAEFSARVVELLERVTELFNRFMRAAHRLVPAALIHMGAYKKASERPMPPE
ncbi:hypothetical protein GPROT1_02015 [Gammaproteobacteria bacterium]|nr:hypothetical protein GPROT1_02015 [Gammaproteobacteria bacterium]